MQQYIIDGYVRSRMQHAGRTLARPTDRWTPPARGPSLRDRVGLTLVSVGVSLLGDRTVLERLRASEPARAA